MNVVEEIKIMYGDRAAYVTITLPDGSTHQQWYCTKCRRTWGAKDQHMASWCCCTHLICECGKEHEKRSTCCDDCRAEKDLVGWLAKPVVEWDGEWPIYDHLSNKYFFTDSDLADYLHWQTVDEGYSVSELIAALRLSSCYENKPRAFDVNEWCCDELSDDGEVADAESIDERINAILAEIPVLSYYMNSDRLNVRQVLQAIGYPEEPQ